MSSSVEPRIVRVTIYTATRWTLRGIGDAADVELDTLDDILWWPVPIAPPPA